MVIKRFSFDTKKYLSYSFVAAKSQLKSEVANSYLNWLWWILDPICFMLIYTFVFGYVFKAAEPYFPVFIFIGLSMWDFFNRMVKSSIKIVKNNKAIVSKVYLPKYILLFTKMWVNGFKMLISFGLVGLMIIFYGIPFTFKYLYFFPILLTLALFTFGCSTYLLHFGVFVEDLSNVISICLRLLFYFTGIFYHITARIPAPYGDMLTACNPLAFLLESMRNSLLYNISPNYTLLSLWFFISIILSWSGVRKIYNNENNYVKVI